MWTLTARCGFRLASGYYFFFSPHVSARARLIMPSTNIEMPRRHHRHTAPAIMLSARCPGRARHNDPPPPKMPMVGSIL